jgi:2-polyprenyl-6-methoxyphenol hydroxylase-like FAD-dependent oxidoreductase
MIVSGGIAGLAMVRALEQQGFGPDLIKRKADAPQGSTGFYLPGYASRALYELGLRDSLSTMAAPIETQRILDNRGAELSVMRLPGNLIVGPCLALAREALHATLLNS